MPPRGNETNCPQSVAVEKPSLYALLEKKDTLHYSAASRCFALLMVWRTQRGFCAMNLDLAAGLGERAASCDPLPSGRLW